MVTLYLPGWNVALNSDIAIDDIKFERCNPKSSPPAINCTFEKDTCSWTQDQGDNFDWLRNNGSTASKNTGPSSDHTLGTGAGRLFAVSALIVRLVRNLNRN